MQTLTPALHVPEAARDDQGTCDAISQADLLRRRGADIGWWRWNRACRHTRSLSELAIRVVASTM
jgi:hypothetical protein